MMYTVLTSLNWLSLVHPDDIFMFVEIFEEHLEQLKLVLEAFRSANFTLKPEKFLGHAVSTDGFRSDPDKMSAVADFSVPRD